MTKMDKDSFQFYRCMLCGTRMGFYEGLSTVKNSRFVRTR